MKFKPLQAKLIFLNWCILISLVILLTACGSQSADDDDDSVSDSGALRFSIVFHDTNDRQEGERAATLDCVGEGIATIEIGVYDESDNSLSSAGPWNCDVGHGTVSGIPAGNNRTVVVFGRSSSGDIIMRGEKTDVTVLAGQTTNVDEPIECYPFFEAWHIAAGRLHSVAVTSGGTLWTWGENTSGQLGLGDTTNRNLPVQASTDTDWAMVDAGNYFTVAVRSNGTLWAWGQNGNGQLGLGDNTNRNLPVQVGTDTDWEVAATGELHTIALKTDGTLWTWGHNGYGQLGLGDSSNRNSPVQVADTD